MVYDPVAHGARCSECPLQGCRVVPPESHASATIAVVGEAPGEQEEKIGKPLVGPSGNEFMKAARGAGLRRNDFHITSAILCQPPNNELKKLLAKISKWNKGEAKASKDEGRTANLMKTPLECCKPRLDNEIGGFDNFLTLGGTGTRAVSGVQGSILALRGGLMELDRPPNGAPMRVMPTLHPSFVLRQQKWAHVLRNDVAKAARWFRGDAEWVPPKVTYNPGPDTLRAFLSDPDRIYTFDIETDGIECLTAHIRCIAIGDANEVMVIGFRSNSQPKDKEGLFLDFYDSTTAFVIGTILGQFFEDETITKAGHNAGYYDRLVLQNQMGVDPKPVLDTMLLHKSVESELPHSLAYVASLYTEAPSWKQDRSGNKLALGGESDHELAEYCANDVAITARVLPPLADQTALRDQAEVWRMDQKMQRICGDMHSVGMFVDQEKRLVEERKLLGVRHALLTEIRGRLEMPVFNPGSVYQMRDVLFTDWGLESHIDATDLKEKETMTGGGDRSTGDLILRTLLTLKTVPKEQREIIKLMRRYRKCLKVLGTYVVKLRPSNMGANLGWDDDDEWVDKELRKKYGEEKRGIVDPRTGRMHPGYNAHVAVTGRLSSSKPINAQNFPSGQRGIIVPAPGHVLVGADMDQLELRIAAALWGVRLYLTAFAEEKDPHSMTAFAVFGNEFCKASGLQPEQFSRPGKLVGKCYDKDGVFLKGASPDATSMRNLSKAVQYASIEKSVRTCVLDERRSVPISEMKPGDWTWAWSTKRHRYEPAQVKHAWCHGEKECVEVTFSWNAPKLGGRQEGSVVVTADHPMLLRNGKLRHAGSLQEGDRLMPFRRGEQFGKYAAVAAANDGVQIGEHRAVMGFYEAGERLTHVHHKDGNPLNNSPDNLEIKDHLSHYNEHKEAIDAGRVNSEKWRAAVRDPETRSAASKKAWEGRRDRQDTDKTFGPRGSVLDVFADKIGVLKDSEVAELAGCTTSLVGMYRAEKDIPPPVGQQGWLRWLLTNEVIWNRLLHDNTDTEMARLVKEQFGVEVTRQAVRSTRKLLGIPAVKKARNEVYPRRASKLDPFAERIGYESDKAIAAEVPCAAVSVSRYRKTHGIPAYWKEAPSGTNHKVVSIKPVGVREVWDLEVDHEDHNFALEAGIFVHNSQYMATVETVHKLIQKTELPSVDPVTKKARNDGTTDLPYAKLPLRRVREMRDNWLEGAREFEFGWEKEIDEYRQLGYLREPVGGRRRDFLDGEEPNQIVNFKVQGGAAGLMNRAIVQLHEAIPPFKWGPGTGIINQCHDSIVVECPEDAADEVAGLLEECLNQTHVDLPGVVFSASADKGMSWKEVG